VQGREARGLREGVGRGRGAGEGEEEREGLRGEGVGDALRFDSLLVFFLCEYIGILLSLSGGTYSQKTETDRADELANGDGARHLELVELSQFVLWYC
jgi:hypothetical protein